MSFDQAETIKNIQDQWILNGDKPRDAPEVLPKVKLSLSEQIRREVAVLLTAPSFKREMAKEMMLLSLPRIPDTDTDTEFVKLADLKDVVGKLISRNVVGQSLATLEKNSQTFGETITGIEQQLVELSDRVEQLEHDMQELTAHEDAATTDNNLKEVASSPMRLTGGGVCPPAQPSSEESTAIIADQLHRLDTQPEKLRNYNDLICKYHRQQAFAETSSCSSANTALIAPLTKSKAGQMWDSPSPVASTTNCIQLENDFERRTAERRQFETNMLMYRKSQFSLKLNRRIGRFTFTLWKNVEEPKDCEE